VNYGATAEGVVAHNGEFAIALYKLALGAPLGLFDQPSLNPFLAAGPDVWHAVASQLAAADVEQARVDQPDLRLPIEVADYVDFYAFIDHATNVGRLFRPDNPLMPNWRHLPVAYHGRSGTVVVSGTPVVRPTGQLGPGEFGPSARLDFELELAFVVGVPSTVGEPVPVDQAADHVFGVVLLNDWSARDIQAWEYQPLGPFLGKSFATSIAPWVTPLADLAGVRVPGPAQDPAPLPYLQTDEPWGLDLTLEAVLNGEVVARSPFAAMYWTMPQLVAHLTVNGASLRTGDLVGSGTVSGPGDDQRGCLLERGGPFLEDGDEVVLRDGGGHRLAEVRGVVSSAVAAPPASG
jgi:fumarylacetoacetase